MESGEDVEETDSMQVEDIEENEVFSSPMVADGKDPSLQTLELDLASGEDPVTLTESSIDKTPPPQNVVTDVKTPTGKSS